MNKIKNFLSLFMMIGMMAMSPQRMWAECTSHNFTETSNGFCTECGAYQPLGTAVNGWYEISNAGQLYSFAELVNSGNKSVKGRLTKDIVVNEGTFDSNGNWSQTGTPRSWTPIGTEFDSFKGHFDGGGFTISGLYINSTSSYVGFFGYVRVGATIEKLGLKNGYFKGERWIGAVCGEFESSTISKCWSDCKVIGTGNLCGGICGKNDNSKITDCYSKGSVVCNDQAGGICGFNYNYSSITNCYSVATVQATDGFRPTYGSICGDNRSNCTVTNCYSSINLKTTGAEDGSTSNCEYNVPVSRFSSGEIAYLLNGGENGKTDGTQAWYQKIPSTSAGSGQTNGDSYPVLKAASGNTVYCAYGTTCTDERTYNNTATEGNPNHTLSGDITWTWSNDHKSATASFTCGRDATHNPVVDAKVTSAVTSNPTCSVMGTTTYTATITINGKTYTDTKEVQDLATTGNHTEPTNFDSNGIKACTVCHVGLSYQSLDAAGGGWYSIANAGQLISFANKVNDGELDIKGRLEKDIDMQGVSFVQMGTSDKKPFKGELDGQYHAIKNLSITAAANSAASLIGYADNATIQRLTVQGTITTSAKFAAGFIGINQNNSSTIQKCISDVDIESSLNGDGTHAGFVGVANAAVALSDCAFIGSITTTNGTDNCAALIGWDNTQKSSATNCYVTATFDNGICDMLLMRHREKGGFPTCYYLNKACDNVQGNKIDADQVTNGELCYLLNGGENGSTDGTQAWYQDLRANGDSYPILKSTGTNTVYRITEATDTDPATYSNTNSNTCDHPVSGEISWDWSEDGKSATASYTCQNNATHKPEIAATVTSKVKYNANCAVMGTTTYTATVEINNTQYTDEKDVQDIPKTSTHTIPSDFDANTGLKICSVCGYQECEPATQITATNRSQFGFTDATYDEYYAIGNAGQLAWFRNFVKSSTNASANAVLTANIDMSPVCHAANTTTGAAKLSWEPIGYSANYLGIFDGNNHEVTNLYIDTDNSNVGFIGTLGKYDEQTNATVKNLTVRGSVKSSSRGFGGIVGYLYGTISGCTNYATVEGTGSSSSWIGGITGYCGSSTVTAKIENCANHGEITCNSQTSDARIAGIAGFAINTEIINCCNDAKVETSGFYVGGIVGQTNANLAIKKSTNSGNIISNNTEYGYAGGIVGGVYGTTDIEECENTGNITCVAHFVGGIVGYAASSISIKNCGNEGAITSTTGYSYMSFAGGIIGNLSASSGLIVMSGCYNTGKITAAGEYVGGIAGDIYTSNSDSYIKDCYTTGSMTCTTTQSYVYIGGAFGYLTCPIVSNVYSAATITKNAAAKDGVGAFIGDNRSTLTNCYYDSDKTDLNFIGYSNTTINASVNGGKSTTAFVSGEVAYLLNGSRSSGTTESPLVWYQKLGNGGDSSPVLTAAEGNTVYAGYDQCLYSYTNTAGLLAAEQGEHNCGDNGICLKCADYYEPATQITATNRSQFGFTDATHDEYYAISNAGQLAWFRDFVNTSVTEGETTTYPNASANAVLTANIDMSPVCHAANTTTGAAKLSWEPIGSSAPYLGIFDGNNHEVTNLYIDTDKSVVGFIGYLGKNDEQTNAAVKNLTVRGSVKSSKSYIGGVAGCLSGIISGCTNYATVEGTGSSSSWIGGITGICSLLTGTVKIENCANKGDITCNSNASTVYIAGIAGLAGNMEITNCCNDAKIETSGNHVGGIVGYGNTNLSIKKSTNSGKIISNYTRESDVAGIIGYIWGTANIEECKNIGNVTGVGLVIGGIAGKVNSTTSIKNCVNEGTITSTMGSYDCSYAGGIIGFADVSSSLFVMSGCNNSATISAAGKYAGGIAGYVNSTYSNSSITNCYTTGNVNSTCTDQYAYIGGAFGQLQCNANNIYSTATITKNAAATNFVGAFSGYTNNSTLTNCYYDSDKTALSFYGAAYNSTIDASINGGKSTAAFASGEVCYLLNGSRSAGTAESPLVWYQAIGRDAYPTFEQNQYAIVKYDATNGYYNDIENLGDYIFEDGTKYDAKLKRTATSLTYKRTFVGTTYNALYVPFAMQSADWSSKADIYRLVNIFENDKDDNGTIDEWVLKVVKLKAGESTKANTPYIIKPKQEGEMELTISNATLARAEENSIDCASWDNEFVFTGSYAEKAIAADSYFFVSTTGGLQYAAENVTLKPQRWYMGIYNKDTDALVAPSTFNTSESGAKAITIICDDDEATGISQMENGEWIIDNDANAVYNLNGQRLNAPKKGINIINGKKIFVK